MLGLSKVPVFSQVPLLVLDYWWSHNPPIHQRTVTPYCIHTIALKVAELQLHVTTPSHCKPLQPLHHCSMPLQPTWGIVSLLHLMRAIACAHTSTRTISLMHVKIACTTVYGTYCDMKLKKMTERPKTSNQIVDHFSLTFINLSLGWLLCFHLWLQSK